VSSIDDLETSVRQSLIEDLRVRDRNDTVVLPVMTVTGVVICGMSSARRDLSPG
jgi:hypothetical protein